MTQLYQSIGIQRFLNKGVHLYSQKIEYQGWLIVPMFWNKHTFTSSCFCPKGRRYIRWKKYSSLEEALSAGDAFVKQRVQELSIKNSQSI